MARQAYFITGTDTGIGKTWAAVALMRHFQNWGKSVIGMKPVASGCELIDGKPVNADALLLQANASVKLPYEQINPYAYLLPISPHLAGKDNPADLNKLAGVFGNLKTQAEVIVVEGAGGWYSPLNGEQTNGDLALLLGLPVILVVGIKLGCINHALLSARAISGDGTPLAGWIANRLHPEEANDRQVIETLTEALAPPLLGILPYSKDRDFDRLAKAIHIGS